MSSRTDLPNSADRRTRGLQPEALGAEDARQGSRGMPVLIVLLAGLILAMLVWIPAEWWGNSIEPAGQPAPVQSETGPSGTTTSPSQSDPAPDP